MATVNAIKVADAQASAANFRRYRREAIPNHTVDTHCGGQRSEAD
jgi:hypothetical protein